ncbi:hypothetical protein N9408_08180, partial [Opitutales bacterium]|nr:hypothetical protein [Opitutales bacterium]
YDLEEDPAETTNLYEKNLEVAARLLAQLKDDISRGRSTDGLNAKNDVAAIKLWKNEKGRNK